MISTNSTSSSVTSNRSSSPSSKIIDVINVCRFCLRSGSNKNLLIQNVCKCINPRLSFSHSDCLQIFCHRFRQTYDCECCQKDFIDIKNQNDDDNGTIVDDGFLKKSQQIFHTIINVEILQDEFYYLLSSIIDLLIITIILAIIIETVRQSSTIIICHTNSKIAYIICIYLIIFLFMKYCYHINRFKQFFQRIKKFL